MLVYGWDGCNDCTIRRVIEFREVHRHLPRMAVLYTLIREQQICGGLTRVIAQWVALETHTSTYDGICWAGISRERRYKFPWF